MDPLPVCKQLCVNQFSTAPNAQSSDSAKQLTWVLQKWCPKLTQGDMFEDCNLEFLQYM